MAADACGEDDGLVYTIVINTEAKECGAQAPADWSVMITLKNGSVASGEVYQVGSDFSAAATAIFLYEEQSMASEGEVTIEFTGEWTDGVEFTGGYWIDGENMPLIEGSFEGVYCFAEVMCG